MEPTWATYMLREWESALGAGGRPIIRAGRCPAMGMVIGLLGGQLPASGSQMPDSFRPFMLRVYRSEGLE